jgi:3-mercaptopyruvate sulfurtransferase SseA
MTIRRFGQIGGHIPGAINVPWSKMVNEDGTLKSADELKNLYESINITTDKEIMTYCVIGERASYTWFVLKYLLSYPNVKTYDGSWLEQSNNMENPIENKKLIKESNYLLYTEMNECILGIALENNGLELMD